MACEGRGFRTVAADADPGERILPLAVLLPANLCIQSSPMLLKDPPNWRSHRLDVVLIVLLATIAACASYRGSALLDSSIVDWNTSSTWFEADIPRVYRNVLNRRSDNARSSQLHPLFSITSNALVTVLKVAARIPPLTAVRAYIAIISAAVVSMLYVTLLIVLRDRLAAVVFCALAMTSSTAMFWGIVPETYVLGCLSILFAFLISAIDDRRRISDVCFVVASSATLSFTITNWMVGFFLASTHRGWKKILMITFSALTIVTLMWLVQSRLFTKADEFSLQSLTRESRYVLATSSGGAYAVTRSFLYHGMIMPAIQNLDRYARPEWPIMTIQFSDIGSGTFVGVPAAIVWTLLLLCGTFALFRMRGLRRFRIFLALSIAGQLMLHLLYGSDTFLYAMHYVPLLILVASFGASTHLRPFVLVGAVLLMMMIVYNNGILLGEALARFQLHAQ